MEKQPRILHGVQEDRLEDSQRADGGVGRYDCPHEIGKTLCLARSGQSGFRLSQSQGFGKRLVERRLPVVRFLTGLVVGVVVVLLGLFCYVRFGFVDPRADQEPGSLEMKVAMPALDASVDRRAPEAKNPIEGTDENLMSGMKIYQANCAGCHGDVSHPHVAFGDSFYPRAPQFAEDPADMAENQNFYIIEHGVRLSGMPAWKTSLKEPEVWQVTTFLSHMSKLPAGVQSAWKAAASQPGVAESASDAGSKPAAKEKAMDMPH
jgi:mono/diheme cytochrome c family protein